MTVKNKKEVKAKMAKTSEVETTEVQVDVSTKEELKNFLLSIRDKMREQAAASIFAVTALHHVLSLPNIYVLLDNENKEIARDIWLRLKQSGMQLKNPPLLFRPDEDESQTTSG